METRLASRAFHLREGLVCNISLTADLLMHIFLMKIGMLLMTIGQL